MCPPPRRGERPLKRWQMRKQRWALYYIPSTACSNPMNAAAGSPPNNCEEHSPSDGPQMPRPSRSGRPARARTGKPA
eukprot:10823075-Alexandrium_andersonii.AAC.1